MLLSAKQLQLQLLQQQHVQQQLPLLLEHQLAAVRACYGTTAKKN